MIGQSQVHAHVYALLNGNECVINLNTEIIFERNLHVHYLHVYLYIIFSFIINTLYVLLVCKGLRIFCPFFRRGYTPCLMVPMDILSMPAISSLR